MPTIAQQIIPLEVPIAIGPQTVEYYNVGGLNNPQFSQTDLDNDGDLDLYVFDQAANVHLAFSWDGEKYVYNKSLVVNFPDLNNWVYLIDYNQDGAADLFSFSDNPAYVGIVVHKGFWQNGVLQFERQYFGSYEMLIYPNEMGNYVFVFTGPNDFPAITDIDNDGDIDILSFDQGGGYVNWYQNFSAENGYGADTLVFELVENCWGGFFESGSMDEVVLAENAGDCAFGKSATQQNPPHGSSSIVPFDFNGNGLTDVLLGDITRTTITKLVNTGSFEQAYITEQSIHYPSYNSSVDILSVPYAHFADVDLDGKQDLLATPQFIFSENVENVWYYRNISTVDTPNFQLQQTDFLQDKMVDLGTETHPAFADVNADGLIDLVVGNYGYYLPGGDRDSRLHLFLNVGTPTAPSFDLATNNWLNFDTLIAWSFSPTFGDLDSDGDLDMLCGSSLGYLYYSENLAGPNNPMFFAPVVEQWMGIHSPENPLGGYGTPLIKDINGDGLPDLLLGEGAGNINYFENQGTAETPFFNPDITADPNNGFWAGIDVKEIGSSQGRSTITYGSVNGDDYFFVGSIKKGVLQYKINDWTTADVELLETPLVSYKQGYDLHPAAADINNDGILDFAIGHERGGLSFYSLDWPDGVSKPDELSNPFTAFCYDGMVQIQSKKVIEHWQLLDVSGRLILSDNCNGNNCYHPIKKIPNGVYVLLVVVDAETFYQKIWVAS